MNLHHFKGLKQKFPACLHASELFNTFYTQKNLLAPAAGSYRAGNTKGFFPSPVLRFFVQTISVCFYKLFLGRSEFPRQHF